jgi:hypothetical protein
MQHMKNDTSSFVGTASVCPSVNENSYNSFLFARPRYLIISAKMHVLERDRVWPSLKPLKTEFLLNNIYKSRPSLTGNTLRLHYKAQPVNAVWGNSCCLL